MYALLFTESQGPTKRNINYVTLESQHDQHSQNWDETFPHPEYNLYSMSHDKKMLDREAVRSVIQQWNANRLDLFALSEPDEVSLQSTCIKYIAF